MPVRQRMLNLRVSEDELAQLKALSERMGLNQSDTVRQLIRKASAELVQSSSKKGKPTR